MKKSDLVTKVAKETGVSKEVAFKAVDAFTKALLTDARSGNIVDMAGLGKIRFTAGKGGKAKASTPSFASISLTPSKSLKMRVSQSRRAKASAAAMFKVKAQGI
jgi:nucleoid DNA-binding protein